MSSLHNSINRKKRGATIKKKKSKSTASRASDPRNMTILFGGGILVGIIIMGVIVSNWFELFQKQSSETKPTIAQTQKKPTPIENQEIVSESKFDFYTLLPKTSTSASNSTKLGSPAKRTLDLQQNTPSYVVQVGSFKNAADADELRAQLTLQGYTAHSQQIRLKSGQYWYRVSIGPFKSHQYALEQQKLLESDNFSNTLLVLQQR